MPNNMILIAASQTTDFTALEELDLAICKRFDVFYRMEDLKEKEIVEMAKAFFTHAQYKNCDEWIDEWCYGKARSLSCPRALEKACFEKIISDMSAKHEPR